MPRFVILRHELTNPQRGNLHYDFMLEQHGVLRTWALAEEPSHGQEIIADALADHRLDYLEYEGPVSKNRGSVSRWDWGKYESLTDSAAVIVVQLSGQRLTGIVRLQARATEFQRWIFNFLA
jgi:DNA polymerase Ligase (LigD)